MVVVEIGDEVGGGVSTTALRGAEYQQPQLFVLDHVGTGKMQSKTGKRRLCDSQATAALGKPHDTGAKKRHKKKTDGKEKRKKEKRNGKKKGRRDSPDAAALFVIDRTGANGS
eukprot:COSAG02_NODE_9823_length_2100_cov_1.534233_1_plen_113_part_00